MHPRYELSASNAVRIYGDPLTLDQIKELKGNHAGRALALKI